MALRLQLAKKCGANQYIYIRHAATPLQSKSLQYDTMYKTTQCNTMHYNAIQCALTLHNECMWNSRPHGMGQRANHQGHMHRRKSNSRGANAQCRNRIVTVLLSQNGLGIVPAAIPLTAGCWGVRPVCRKNCGSRHARRRFEETPSASWPAIGGPS